MDDLELIWFLLEYEHMDIEMLKEVVPMLRQTLEKAMLDRNYVQLERVRAITFHFISLILTYFVIFFRMRFNNILIQQNVKSEN